MGSTCAELKEEFSAFIDGQLDPGKQEEVSAHLNVCSSCKGELNGLRKLSNLLGATLKLEERAVPDIWSSVEKQLPSVCEMMREDLSAYLDGELTAPAQEGVNQHLKECEPCLSSFKQLNNTNGLIVKGLELPDQFKVDLWTAVKARLNEDCVLIESELSAFADQAVATLRHRAITNHLLDCPDCRGKFNALSSVGDAIRESYKPSIPDDFDLWPAIKSKLQVVPFAPRTQEKTRVANRKVYWAVAAAAFVGIAAALTFSVSPPTITAQEAVTAEDYLINTAFSEPSDATEAVVYEQ